MVIEGIIFDIQSFNNEKSIIMWQDDINSVYMYHFIMNILRTAGNVIRFVLWK